MAEQKKTKTKTRPKQFNKPIIILFIVLIAIIVISGIYKFVVTKGQEQAEQERLQAQQQQQADYNARLQEIQNEIDKQQAVIDEINQKMKPLVEERTELERQLIEK